MQSPARLLSVALCAGLLAGLPAAAPADATTLQRVEVKAHRGGPVGFGLPEESLALLTKAAAAGVAWVESDVVFTSDGVPVLQHGDQIGGGGTGSSDCGPTDTGRSIHTMTWEQVSAVRCTYNGVAEPIARLDDVVSMLAAYPTVKVDLEVKTYSGQSVEEENAWMKATLIATAPLHPRMSISSFAWRDVAATVEQYGPKTYFLALEYADKMKLATNDVYAMLDRAKKLGVDGLGYNVNSSDEAELAYQRALGIDPHLYDLKSDQEYRFALGNGQRVLGADDPAHVSALVAKQKGKRPVPAYHRTLLAKSVKVLTGTKVAKGTRLYPQVMGSAGLVPTSAQNQFAGVRFTVKVVAKRSSGKLEIAPRGSRVGKDGKRISVRKGTHSYTIYVSPGDAGKVRVMTTSKSSLKVTLTVTGYRRAIY